MNPFPSVIAPNVLILCVKLKAEALGCGNLLTRPFIFGDGGRDFHLGRDSWRIIIARTRASEWERDRYGLRRRLADGGEGECRRNMSARWMRDGRAPILLSLLCLLMNLSFKQFFALSDSLRRFLLLSGSSWRCDRNSISFHFSWILNKHEGRKTTKGTEGESREKKLRQDET